MEVKTMEVKKAEFNAEIEYLGLQKDIETIRLLTDMITEVFGKPKGMEIMTSEGKTLWPRR